MSSSNASIAYADTLNKITIIFVQCWSYPMFVFGIIGHLLSIYVLTRPVLWTNPCSRYFLASSISGLCVICYNLPTRLLQLAYRISIFTISVTACKIFTYMTFWIRAQTAWFVVLASADRFLCSSKSAAVRKWSNIRITSFMIFFTTLMIGVAYIHVPIYYQANLVKQTCSPMQGIYQTFYGIWNLIIFGLSPSILMLSFGMLTIKHIHGTRRQVIPSKSSHNAVNTTTQQQNRRKKTDNQLIRMMIVQCIVFSVTATPNSINYIYTSISPVVTSNIVAVAVANLISNVVGFLSLTGPCVSFYLFTLASKLFRTELVRLFTCQSY